MKSLVKTFLVTSLILLFSAFGFSQTTITITLIVDTDTFERDDWRASCHFEAEWADTGHVITNNGDLEDFLVEAFVDDTIIWEGESSSSEHVIVDITKIKYKKGTRIFKNKTNDGKKPNGSKKEKVKTKALYSTQDKPDYKYDLTFKIKHLGSFTIDPKMRIGPR